MEQFIGHLVAGFILSFGFLTFALPIILGILMFFGFFTILNEAQCKVYVLFGDVVGILEEPGLHFLILELGWRAFFVHWLGTVHVLDMRSDQVYLRSQPVNSEEGAPMGIGIWYEMYISDPISYLFRNQDPRGSLAANVSSSTIRCLSNMPLAQMLETRHQMSQTVRNEVSPKSQEWGYRLGSTYIRKVHFRDPPMIKQIEEKVVNRLRQVTSSIKQDGDNQVNIIASSADKTAAVDFAKAGAIRPQIVGKALENIAKDPEISEALFSILETEKLLESKGNLVLIPELKSFFKRDNDSKG